MDGTIGRINYPHEDPPEPATPREIGEGVLWFRLPLPMALDHVNVYALEDEDGWTIVDTGLRSRKTKEIWTHILSGPLSARPVNRVLVTHHHPDHMGLAGWFQSEHGAELITTRTAWLFARMLQLDAQEVPTAQSMDFWRAAGMDERRLDDRSRQRPFNFADTVEPMPLGFQRIAQGDSIRAGGRTWDVRIGNGHAPEHATLWSRDDNLVIGGDQLLPSISPNLGVYATEPEADPVADWMESCRGFLEHAREDQLVLPGHKRPFNGLPTRLRQLIENHEGALKRVERFLSEPRTAVECFDTLFKRPIGEGEYGLALVEAMAHVLHLWHSGKVTRSRREDGAWLWQTKG